MEPERHYADADQTIRVYSEMNTGKWWWCTQVSHTYSRVQLFQIVILEGTRGPDRENGMYHNPHYHILRQDSAYLVSWKVSLSSVYDNRKSS